MTDSRFDPSEPAPRAAMLGQAIDSAVRRITTAIVISGAVVGLAIYARPGPPRFQALVDGNRIVRIDTRKGSIISCEGQQTCQLILRSGQRLIRVKRSDSPPPQALPAPAAATLPPASPAAGK